MRIIDADKLKECDFGEYGYEMRYEISRQPTVKAIPVEKLEQILSKIQSLRGCSCSCSDGIIDDVEDIIDEIIKEIE